MQEFINDTGPKLSHWPWAIGQVLLLSPVRYLAYWNMTNPLYERKYGNSLWNSIYGCLVPGTPLLSITKSWNSPTPQVIIVVALIQLIQLTFCSSLVIFFSPPAIFQMWFVMDIIDWPSRLYFISNYIDLTVQSCFNV